MAENTHPFLEALNINEEQYLDLPDFLVKGEPPDKVRLCFHNKMEPPINLGDFTVITVSPQDFIKVLQLYIDMGKLVNKIDRTLQDKG